jgi:hypothetical protein
VGTGPAEPVPAPPRRGRWIALGVIAVAIVVVLALLLTGIVPSPLHPAKTSPGPSTESFDAAYASANSTARSQSGAPWSLVDAIGLGSEEAIAIPSPNSSSPCLTPAGPASVPAISASSMESGTVSYWGFDFTDAAQEDLEVTVFDGSVTGTAVSPASGHCLGTPVGGIGVLAPSSRIEDSSTAVAQLGSNLSGFITQYNAMTVEYVLDDEGDEVGSLSGTAVWAVGASPCLTNLTAPLPIGDPTYIGAVNGTDGKVFGSLALPEAGKCMTNGTLNRDLALGPGSVTGATVGVNFTMQVFSAGGSLTAGNLTPVLVNTKNSTSITGGPLYLLAQNGTTLAEYSFNASSWVSGSAAPIQSGDVFVLEGTALLEGLGLVLEGTGSFTGDVSVSLP